MVNWARFLWKGEEPHSDLEIGSKEVRRGVTFSTPFQLMADPDAIAVRALKRQWASRSMCMCVCTVLSTSGPALRSKTPEKICSPSVFAT